MRITEPKTQLVQDERRRVALVAAGHRGQLPPQLVAIDDDGYLVLKVTGCADDGEIFVSECDSPGSAPGHVVLAAWTLRSKVEQACEVFPRVPRAGVELWWIAQKTDAPVPQQPWQNTPGLTLGDAGTVVCAVRVQ
jgi:hypothetical protein